MSKGSRVLRPESAPLVSVIMANFEGGQHIERALRSVCAQTLTSLEIIVADDASGDDSVARVRSTAASDSRIRLIEAPENGGPARARNRALATARGKWVAIVDADDVIHPERFERMLALAEQEGSDIVADDLLHFYGDGSPSHYLLPDRPGPTRTISAEEWILAGLNGRPVLGYLKPIIRADSLGSERYDESLQIGEDYDFVLRLLLKGARFTFVPEPWYLYRRHRASLSHRIELHHLESMLAGDRRILAGDAVLSPGVRTALRRRVRDVEAAHAFAVLVKNLKRRSVIATAATLLRRPSLILRLLQSVKERAERQGRLAPAPGQDKKVARRVVLAAASAEPGADVQIVPAYVPASAMMTSHHEGRSIWRHVVDLAGSGGTQILARGEAGRYAAGFIPFESESAALPRASAFMEAQ